MTYQTIIIGAGPAGATAAKFLAENNINVLLIDKAPFPRDKPCGGGIPYRVFQEFSYLTESGLIDSYSYGGYLHSSHLQHHVMFEQNQPLAAMVLRKTFDHGLVKLAIKAGAEFRSETELVELHNTKKK